MVFDKHSGCVVGIDAELLELVDNNYASLLLVFSHLTGCHVIGARNVLVEIVGVSSADVWNVATSLCKGGGIG